MIYPSDLTKYKFSDISEYYKLIIAVFTQGNINEVHNLFNDLSRSQQLEAMDYFVTNDFTDLYFLEVLIK